MTGFFGGQKGRRACARLPVWYSLFVPFFGIMFVVSVVSVILQVFSFKVFKRRIFRMAPFHHHLQEKGIAENRVVQIYVAVSVAVSLLLMALTYLR